LLAVDGGDFSAPAREGFFEAEVYDYADVVTVAGEGEVGFLQHISHLS
jgi:hypothetical protein